MMKSTETKQDASKINKYDYELDGFDKPVRVLCNNFVRTSQNGDVKFLTLFAYFDDTYGCEISAASESSKLKKFNKFSKLKQNDIIWVTFDGGEVYFPRHFSHCEGDMVYFFVDGCSSFTAKYSDIRHDSILGNDVIYRHEDECLTEEEMLHY